jgi:hypothetical protein
VAVVQAVDQVQVARPAGAGADGKLAGQRSLRACREGRDLFVADMHPIDIAAPAQGFSQAVETVADDAVDAAHAGCMQDVGDEVGDFAGHIPYSVVRNGCLPIRRQTLFSFGFFAVRVNCCHCRSTWASMFGE